MKQECVRARRGVPLHNEAEMIPGEKMIMAILWGTSSQGSNFHLEIYLSAGLSTDDRLA